MVATMDNATAIPNNTRGELPKRDVTRRVTALGIAKRGRTGLTLADGHTTLGDGHARPSENAATRAASTKGQTLMGTLFSASSAPVNVTSRCYLLLPADPSRHFFPGTMELFSARVLRKAPRNSNPINKTGKTSRHAFQLCGPDEEAYRN
jgi:hypothetical protein